MSLPYIGTFRATKLYGTPPPAGVSYSTGKHAGVDFVGVASKEVRAVMGGTIHRSSIDYNGWGKYVVVHQTDGMFAIYCHLSKAYKTAGQSVKTGEMIGIEGSTGQVTGQHLHFELRKNYSDKYSTIDPMKYLGLHNAVGVVKLESDEMLTTVKIKINGKEKTVTAIVKDGNNYIKVRDIADDKIIVGNIGAMPTIDVRK